MPTITQYQAIRLNIPHHSLQTILFDNKIWNVRMAKKWLKEHEFRNNTYRKTTNEIRFMQINPIEGASYYSKKLKDGIILVFQNY